MAQNNFLTRVSEPPATQAELLRQRLEEPKTVSDLNDYRFELLSDIESYLKIVAENSEHWLLGAGFSEKAAEAISNDLQITIPDCKRSLIPIIADRSGILELQARIELGIESREELAWTQAALVGATYAFCKAIYLWAPSVAGELEIEMSDIQIQDLLRDADSILKSNPIIKELIDNERDKHNPSGVKTFLKAAFPFSNDTMTTFSSIAKSIRKAISSTCDTPAPEIELNYLKQAGISAVVSAGTVGLWLYSLMPVLANQTVALGVSGFLAACVGCIASLPFLKRGINTLNDKMTSYLRGGLYSDYKVLEKDVQYLRDIRDRTSSYIGELFPRELRDLKELKLKHPTFGEVSLGDLRTLSPVFDDFLKLLEELAEDNIFDKPISIYQLMQLDDALSNPTENEHFILLRNAVHQRLTELYPKHSTYNPRPKIPLDLMRLSLDSHFAKKAVDLGLVDQDLATQALRHRMNLILVPLSQTTVRALHPVISLFEAHIDSVVRNSTPESVDKILNPRKSIETAYSTDIIRGNQLGSAFWEHIVGLGMEQKI